MLPHPFLSAETTIKALGHAFSFTPSASRLTLVLPHVALRGVACSLFLGTVNNKLLFQKQLSLCLSPYHT